MSLTPAETSETATAAPTPAAVDAPPVTRWFRAGFAVLVLGQVFVAFMGAGDRFCQGHNGWNSSAYLQAARNTLRWGALFPVQYYTGATAPPAELGYTHHPLAMHLHNVLSLALFGDHEASVRVVPALYAVLALLALVLVVRRLYGPATALVAGALYLVSPINAIFANMSNHENGFIFWMLLCALAYLRVVDARAPLGARPPTRARRWYALMLVAFFWAAMWDWPAYYCALILACHWLAVLLTRDRPTRPNGETASTRVRLGRLGPDLALLAGFSAFVLALFIGHFVLVSAVVGSTSELQGVFEARQAASTATVLHHLEVVPILMFSLPVLLLAFGWFFHRAYRAIRGRLARRDLVALMFAIAGLLHYIVFRGTAVLHEYWGWTLLPFTSIACAHVLVRSVKHIHTLLDTRLASRPPALRRSAFITSVALVAAVVALPLGERLFDLVPRGRAVGGSLWLGVAPTRITMGPYVSGRDVDRFVAEVNAETTRQVGVMMDPSFRDIYPYEPRIEITLDRELVYETWQGTGVLPTRDGVTEGWVYLAPLRRLSERRFLQLAYAHPVLVFDGHYLMVDLRTRGTSVRVLASRPSERSFWSWYWDGPWAEAVEMVEQPDEAARLAAKARAFYTGL